MDLVLFDCNRLSAHSLWPLIDSNKSYHIVKPPDSLVHVDANTIQMDLLVEIREEDDTLSLSHVRMFVEKSFRNHSAKLMHVPPPFGAPHVFAVAQEAFFGRFTPQGLLIGTLDGHIVHRDERWSCNGFGPHFLAHSSPLITWSFCDFSTGFCVVDYSSQQLFTYESVSDAQ